MAKKRIVAMLNFDNDTLKAHDVDLKLFNRISGLLAEEPEEPLPSGVIADFPWPVKNVAPFVTQAFGANPEVYRKFGVPAHEGIDMRTGFNAEIVAVWPGVVYQKYKSDIYGHHVRLRHKIGECMFETIYAHFWRSSGLSVGQTVEQGEQVGRSGSSGRSTGAHLHFGLKLHSANCAKPATPAQQRYNWPFNIIDPTPYFEYLRDG
jgi:murein DD-endopeptidase MepM/ murein hydrolase activator NlpD